MCTFANKLLMVCGSTPPVFEYGVIGLTIAAACMILMRPR
jgi:hypothetical protein